MCHRERKMGTMVERIQAISPANFLCNMVKIFASTSNTQAQKCKVLVPRSLEMHQTKN